MRAEPTRRGAAAIAVPADTMVSPQDQLSRGRFAADIGPSRGLSQTPTHPTLRQVVYQARTSSIRWDSSDTRGAFHEPDLAYIASPEERRAWARLESLQEP